MLVKNRNFFIPPAFDDPLRGLRQNTPLQTGSHSASLSAEQDPIVPGGLLYTSLKHSQPTSFTVSHLTSPDRTTLPAQHFRSSGLLCRWSDSLELATRQSPRPGAQQQQLQTIADRWAYRISQTSERLFRESIMRQHSLTLFPLAVSLPTQTLFPVTMQRFGL